MRWAYLILGFLVGLVAAQAVKFPSPEGQTVKGVVTAVIDGDTIKVRINGKEETVRIIGYDAPEKEHSFGDKATLFLKALIEGREVILESDVQTVDKYGRRLYHVWVPNVLVSELMLLSGLGLTMTVPPNVKHTDFLERTQNYAQKIGLGMWSVMFQSRSQTFFPSLGAWTTSQGLRQSTTQTSSDIVYITRTGTRFHRAGCRYLQYSAIPITRSEAIARGYTPCKICRP
jgi:micrococcal nuclease